MPILPLPNTFMAGPSSPRPDRISRVSEAELGAPPRHVLLELGPPARAVPSESRQSAVIVGVEVSL
jgi:hypothetical protein